MKRRKKRKKEKRRSEVHSLSIIQRAKRENKPMNKQITSFDHIHIHHPNSYACAGASHPL